MITLCHSTSVLMRLIVHGPLLFGAAEDRSQLLKGELLPEYFTVENRLILLHLAFTVNFLRYYSGCLILLSSRNY